MDSQTLRSIIKSARDEMRKDAGTNTDVDRTPQITWMLFLKCYDDFEKKFEALDIDVEVDFDDPGGAYDLNLPYLRVFDAGGGKNLISVRSKVRLNDEGKLKEFRHYVQKEKGLVELLKVAKE